MCNPPETTIKTDVVGPSYPTSNASVSGFAPWSNANNGHTSDVVYATATPPNPNGASTGPSFGPIVVAGAP